MFNSEITELSLIRKEETKRLVIKHNALVVVMPQYSSFEDEGLKGLTNLAHYGEFLLNAENPITDVFIVQPPSIWPIPENAIPEMFLNYLDLWSEYNKKDIVYIYDIKNLVINDKCHVFFALGGASQDAKDTFQSVISHVTKSTDCQLSLVPGPPVEIIGLKFKHVNNNRFDVFDFENMPSLKHHFKDPNFSFEKFNKNLYSEEAKDEESFIEPRMNIHFPSFTGIFFRFECDTNPIAQVVTSLEKRRGLGKLKYAGPNPIVFYDDGNSARDYKIFMEPEETPIQALLRLSPELAKNKLKLKVAYRGYIESVDNTLDSWLEGIVFTQESNTGRWEKDIPHVFREATLKSNVVTVYTPIIPNAKTLVRNFNDFKTTKEYNSVDWRSLLTKSNGWTYNKQSRFNGSSLLFWVENVKWSDLNEKKIVTELGNILNNTNHTIMLEELYS
jgi:hypothetical protein